MDGPLPTVLRPLIAGPPARARAVTVAATSAPPPSPDRAADQVGTDHTYRPYPHTQCPDLGYHKAGRPHQGRCTIPRTANRNSCSGTYTADFVDQLAGPGGDRRDTGETCQVVG